MTTNHEAIQGKEGIRERFKILFDQESGSFNIEAVKTLTEDVSKHDGKVFILMHPFYEDAHGMSDAYKKMYGDGLEVGLQNFDREAEMYLSDPSIPTIIFEERGNMEVTANRCVAKEIVPSKDVYVLPTLNDFGVPYFPKSSNEVVDPLVYENHMAWVAQREDQTGSGIVKDLAIERNILAWAALIDFMQECGIREVFLGGKYLDISEQDNEQIYGRCLGDAYDYLDFNVHRMENVDMKIHLTDLTFPLLPEEMNGVLTTRQRIFGKE